MKSKYAGLEVNEPLKALEDENRRLKHLVADELLQAIVRKNGWSLLA